MNIALFSDSYLPTKSGIVTVVVQLRHALEALGHHVVVVTVETTDDIGDDPLVYRALSVPLGLGTDQYFGLPNIIKVVSFLREHKVELIHCHTEFFVAHVAKLAGKKLKVPVIATTHTMWEDFYAHYFPHAKYVVRPQAVRKIVRWLYKKFYALINVSPKAEHYFKRPDMQPNIPSVIIPNAIDVSSFMPAFVDEGELDGLRAELGITANDVLLLFVGRIAEEKRVLELLDICAEILIMRSNAKVLFVGSGPMIETMQRHAHQYKVENRMMWTGFVEWRSLYKYYSIGDLFVTASLSEMHSMTILEAMFAELPVLVRDDLSYEGTVINGVNGYRATSDDEFVTSAVSLIDDAQRRKQFGAESKKISETFKMDVHVKRTLAFYEYVIEAYKSGRGIDEKKAREKAACHLCVPV